MKNTILLVLLLFLIPTLIIGQTQEATTSDGKKVILNADGTWKYAVEATTSDGKKIILNADGTWKFAEEDRISAEQKSQADIINRTNKALANSKNGGTISTGESITGGSGNQEVPTASVNLKVRGEGGGLGDKGISYDLQGRGVQQLPSPKYDYQGEGRVVVEVSVDRDGKVIQAVAGKRGSTTADEYLLKAAHDAAMLARFNVKTDAPAVQKGTITFNFTLK